MPTEPPPGRESTAELPSKSAAKREMAAYQELGRKLLDLAPARLAAIPLSEELRDALALASRMKQRHAYSRQLRLIGKLISQENVPAISAAQDGFVEQDRCFRQHFHRLEALREKLLAEADPAIENLVKKYPSLDRQHLRQLVRQARRELAQGKPPGSSRKLFRYLRDNLAPEYPVP